MGDAVREQQPRDPGGNVHICRAACTWNRSSSFRKWCSRSIQASYADRPVRPTAEQPGDSGCLRAPPGLVQRRGTRIGPRTGPGVAGSRSDVAHTCGSVGWMFTTSRRIARPIDGRVGKLSMWSRSFRAVSRSARVASSSVRKVTRSGPDRPRTPGSAVRSHVDGAIRETSVRIAVSRRGCPSACCLASRRRPRCRVVAHVLVAEPAVESWPAEELEFVRRREREWADGEWDEVARLEASSGDRDVRAVTDRLDHADFRWAAGDDGRGGQGKDEPSRSVGERDVPHVPAVLLWPAARPPAVRARGRGRPPGPSRTGRTGGAGDRASGPGPLSSTTTSNGPAGMAVRNRTQPPAGAASTPLRIRAVRAIRSCFGSASIQRAEPGRPVSTSTCRSAGQGADGVGGASRTQPRRGRPTRGSWLGGRANCISSVSSGVDPLASGG